jgi:hypothetical protein
MQGDNLVQIAGLLEMCSRDIYREAPSIKKLCPDALTEHTEAVVCHIDFLASALKRIGEEIEEEGNEAADAVRMMAEGGGQ